jgi:acetyl-CoA synthetase
MRSINLRYVDEEYDGKGVLVRYGLRYPDDYNFGYDIVDDIAVNDPDRTAMVWCNQEGDERRFTFGDMKRLSDRTANYLASLGVRKGDFVMVVLKRNWQFWPVAVALHKMGAVLVPATFMLKKHDVEYRVNSASIKAVIATCQSGVPEVFDEAEADCPTLGIKVMAGGSRPGWHDLDAGIEAASDEWTRVPTAAREPSIMYFSSGTTGYPKMVLHDHLYSLGHLLTAKHWHCVDPEGLHFTIADTGWGKAVWGKLYGQWIMESAVFVYDHDGSTQPRSCRDIRYRITTSAAPDHVQDVLLHGAERYDSPASSTAP